MCAKDVHYHDLPTPQAYVEQVLDVGPEDRGDRGAFHRQANTYLFLPGLCSPQV